MHKHIISKGNCLVNRKKDTTLLQPFVLVIDAFKGFIGIDMVQIVSVW